mmetsp:Transcript_51165/g.111496  ORF Transcript_51165/g.111496 Transcript_51165/m.111496 type:complete len:217 (+) Transcript_51165:147-797(+)
MYGLRLMDNNRPASLDGREWSIYGSEDFNKGKVSHGLKVKGVAPVEVLHGNHVRKSHAAGAALAARGGLAATAHKAASGTGRGKVLPQVVRRWMDHAASSSTYIPQCQHDDLFRPPPELTPTMPVAKLHYSSEPFARNSDRPEHLTKELPENHLYPHGPGGSLPIDKMFYHSNNSAYHAMKRREEQRAQERTKAGSTYGKMPQTQLAKSASAPGIS